MRRNCELTDERRGEVRLVRRLRAAILFSGRGSNMASLLRASGEPDYPIDYRLAISDHADAPGHQIASTFGIPSLHIAPNIPAGPGFEERLHEALENDAIELVLLAGFMRVLSPRFVAKWRERILNIHPSLLPRFKGLNPQQQALNAGAKESGCSVHVVTQALDGGPVLAQSRVPIMQGDDVEALSARILVEEHKLYPKVAADYARKLGAERPQEMPLETPFTGLKEKCGVFGIHAQSGALPLTIFGMHALQHRGQEGAGIASFHEGDILAHRGQGLVSEIFSRDKMEDVRLPGHQMIGHLRYSTAGDKNADNLQPFTMLTRFGKLALAHNGNLTNTEELRQYLMDAGQVFFTDSDSEIFLHLIAQSAHEDLRAAFIEACQQVTGAFSLLLLSGEGIFAARDPFGLRPLSIGRSGGSIAIASESTALEATELEWESDIDAGEMVEISPDGEITRQYYTKKRERSAQHFCAFEYIYFMRANSAFNGRYTARVRERIGMQLFNESPAEADYVVPVPESGIFAAIGYAQAAAMPFHFAILKSSYIGRTFIAPQAELRHLGVRLKLSVDRWHVKDKRILLVDDSIVRANTIPKLVRLLREAGALEVHVRIAAPPIIYPCFYGIDMPSRDELAASNMNVSEICGHIGADSLAFITPEGLRRAIDAKDNEAMAAREQVPKAIGCCMACFTGEYPSAICDANMKEQLAGVDAHYSAKSPGLLFVNRRGEVPAQ